jgi:hypothetical protein
MSQDWTKLYKQYRGQWVALKDDEQTVVGSGETAKQALAESRKQGYEQPILTRMPTDLTPFIG